MLNVVTGGAGFLGSHLVRALTERGMKVRVLLRPATSPASLPAGVETRTGDIRPGRIYHVADGFGITCTRYLSAMATTLGLPVPKRRIPRALVQPLMALLMPPEPEPKGTTRPSQGALLRLCALFRDSEPDISRIREELGYAPPVDFATGVAETVAWYRSTLPATQA